MKKIRLLSLLLIISSFLQAQSYMVNTSGTFNPALVTGGAIIIDFSSIDITGAIPIGFSFEFYGDTYTEFYISKNGYITFSDPLGNAGNGIPQNIPNPNSPNNLIALSWSELDPTIAGQVRYEVIGSAPNRVLIVDYDGVTDNASSGALTTQIKLFESTNVFEIHTTSKSTGVATQGVERKFALDGLTLSGRNSTIFSLSNDFIGFSPKPSFIEALCQPVSVILNTSNEGILIPSDLDNGSSTDFDDLYFGFETDAFETEITNSNPVDLNEKYFLSEFNVPVSGTYTINLTGASSDPTTVLNSVVIWSVKPIVSAIDFVSRPGYEGFLATQNDGTFAAGTQTFNFEAGVTYYSYLFKPVGTDKTGLISISFDQFIYSTAAKETYSCLDSGIFTKTLYIFDTGGNIDTCDSQITIQANEVEWDGTSWSSGLAPGIGEIAILSGDYDTSSSNIDACGIINTSNLTIRSGDYVRTQSDILNQGAIVIENGGSFVQVDDNALALNSGTISIEKTTPTFNDRDFTIMSSPLSEETREGVYLGTAIVRYHDTNLFVPHPDIETYDPGAENFADDNGDNWIPHTGALTEGEGYLVKPFFIGDADGTYTATYTQGTFNNGVINFTAIFGDDKNDSPNILGNPYASALDADKFITDNALVDAIYYWEHITTPQDDINYPGYNPNNYEMGDISLYNLSGGVAAANAGGGSQDSNQYIPSGQGFGIKANAAGTITFNNSMRLVSNNDNYRSQDISIQKLYIQITNKTYGLKNSTLVAFTENATDGYDKNYDAKRLATSVSIYSLNENVELGIQGRSVFTNNQIIPIGFSTHINEFQEYKISLSELKGDIINQTSVFLKDNYLNTLTNLSTTDYLFNANQGNQQDRFVIVFSEEILSNSDLNQEAILLYPNPTKNTTSITSTQTTIRSIELIDLRGRTISTIPNINMNTYQVDLSNLDAAMYFVKINTDLGSINKRIIKN